MKNSIYKLIILCGKAGAGKDYLLQKVYKLHHNDLNLIISDTTRPPRLPNEQNGVSYNFLTPEEFKKRKHIETSSFNNWLYGIPIDSLRKDKINIGVLNLNSIIQIQHDKSIDLKIFYITAKDKTRIIRQINREINPSITEICRRFLADEMDFSDIKSLQCTELKNDNTADVIYSIQNISNLINEWTKENNNI